MIGLCDEVKLASEKPGADVYIDPREWHDVSVIRDVDDCWVHAFVVAPQPAA
jgi:hypothetical protein